MSRLMYIPPNPHTTPDRNCTRDCWLEPPQCWTPILGAHCQGVIAVFRDHTRSVTEQNNINSMVFIFFISICAWSCECEAGYKGRRCGRNINECASTPCQNGGTCEDGINAYTCTCPANYTGVNCDAGECLCIDMYIETSLVQTPLIRKPLFWTLSAGNACINSQKHYFVPFRLSGHLLTKQFLWEMHRLD